MTYTCSVCQKTVEGDLISFSKHTEEHIVDLIKQRHPDWQDQDGLCQKCVDYYRQQIAGAD